MPPLADQTTAAVHLSCLTAATLQLSRVDTAAAAVQCGLGGVLGRGTSGVQGVAVVQRAVRGESPEQCMHGWGFGSLVLVNTFAVSMAGSGRKICCSPLVLRKFLTSVLFTATFERRASLNRRSAPTSPTLRTTGARRSDTRWARETGANAGGAAALEEAERVALRSESGLF